MLEPSSKSEISSKEWVKKLIKDVHKETYENICAYASIVEELGITEAKRVHWTILYKKYVTEVCNEMLEEVKTKRSELIKGIEILLLQSEVLHKKLGIPLPAHGAEEKGLYQERDILVEKIKELASEVKEREEEFSALKEQEEKLCATLGRPAKFISKSPLPNIKDFGNYLKDLESEKLSREKTFLKIREEILALVKELNIEPTTDFGKIISSPHDFLFEVTDANMQQLKEYRGCLKKQVTDVKKETDNLRKELEVVWDLLDIPFPIRDELRKKNVGHTLDIKESLKNELKKCENLKRENIKILIKKMRVKLQNLWDQCRITDDQIKHFDFINYDLYNEDLLEIHEREINKWESMLSHNKELFDLLEKHESLWCKMQELEYKAVEPERYKNRGGQLLKEEKERNKLSKQIPIIETKLIALAKVYKERDGKEFLTWGFTVNEYIEQVHLDGEENRKNIVNIRKQQRGFTSGSSTQNLLTNQPSASAKRKIIASSVDLTTRRKLVNKEYAVTVPIITLNSKALRHSTEAKRRIIRNRRLSRKKVLALCDNVSKETISNEYNIFEKEISACSSEHFNQVPLNSNQLTTPVKEAPETDITSRLTSSAKEKHGRKSAK